MLHPFNLKSPENASTEAFMVNLLSLYYCLFLYVHKVWNLPVHFSKIQLLGLNWAQFLSCQRLLIDNFVHVWSSANYLSYQWYQVIKPHSTSLNNSKLSTVSVLIEFNQANVHYEQIKSHLMRSHSSIF